MEAEAEAEAVRDEARHLPRRLRAGRATLMVGRSRRISIREAGGADNEGGGGRSLFLCISLTRARDFFGPRKWISIDGIHIRLAAGHRGSQSDGYAALLEELPFSGYNHVMTCSTMYLSKSTSSHVG
jgi:hypothetical protein